MTLSNQLYKPKNRLNLRMRDRKGGALPAHKKLNLYGIRSIEQFDYNRLREIEDKLPDLDAPSLKIFEYDNTAGSIDVWPIRSLDTNIQTLDDSSSEKAILSWCINVITKSQLAGDLLAEAKKLGWKIGLDDLAGHDFHLDIPAKTLFIHNHSLLPSAIAKSSYFMNATITAIIRGLRDIWQEKRHGAFEDHYGPQDILLMERVRAADLDVICVMALWELKFKNHPELWRHMLAAKEGDIAMTYMAALERQSNAKSFIPPAVVAFRQWFESDERLNSCDHETLDYLDGLINDDAGLIAFGNKKPTPVGVELLSCQPDKTAYLKGWGGDILNDPEYVGLKDPINQAHLMQLLNDMHVTYVQGVPFRDVSLAQKIFPSGKNTIH